MTLALWEGLNLPHYLELSFPPPKLTPLLETLKVLSILS